MSVSCCSPHNLCSLYQTQPLATIALSPHGLQSHQSLALLAFSPLWPLAPVAISPYGLQPLWPLAPLAFTPVAFRPYGLQPQWSLAPPWPLAHSPQPPWPLAPKALSLNVHQPLQPLKKSLLSHLGAKAFLPCFIFHQRWLKFCSFLINIMKNQLSSNRETSINTFIFQQNKEKNSINLTENFDHGIENEVELSLNVYKLLKNHFYLVIRFLCPFCKMNQMMCCNGWVIGL